MKIEWTRAMTKRVVTYIAAGTGILLVYFIILNFNK